MTLSDSVLRRWILRAYLWATERLYHQWAWAYDGVAWLVSFGRWAEWRRAGLGYLEAGPTLEVGFGTGELLGTMVEMGLDVVGLELSTEMHRVTRAKLARRGIAVDRVRGRSEALPLPAGCFKTIIVTFPTQYIVQKSTLREFYRILVDTGRVVIIGTGVHFKSPLKRWLTAWFLEDSEGVLIRSLAAKGEQAGLRPNVVTYQDRVYSLPVLILERQAEDEITKA